MKKVLEVVGLWFLITSLFTILCCVISAGEKLGTNDGQSMLTQVTATGLICFGVFGFAVGLLMAMIFAEDF